MKKQILISLILLSSTLTMNAQTLNGSSINLSRLQDNTDWTALRIDNSGSWGAASNKYAQILFTDGNGNVAGLGATYNGSTGIGRLDFNALYNLGYGSTSNAVMSILGNHSVGIGTTEPTATLDVNGNVNLNNQHSSLSDYLNPGYYVYKSGTVAYGMKLQYVEGKYGTMIFGPNQSDRFIGFGKVGDELKDSKMVEFMRIDLNTGNLLIGKTIQQNSIYKLDVNGPIRANEIIVNLNGADFVFEKGYKLMPLTELEKFVKEQKHLPEVASAKEMKENGTDLGNLNSKLLQKIEELTLYTIEQNKKIIELEKQNAKIEQQNKDLQVLKEKIAKLEAVSK